ncbi:MAG: SDR family NAD(P)-dependent oxidoreductase [SAR116 cluster bacterium]|nr:short-chain dehydrogenase [Paracoccaceae bacterium]RCL80627.1 MAG: SDR family NAD(P)-dependent oxidoreductase [SAR116 cluster bacterium]RPH14141.1 MAG: SDR family oxidoreductase [Alphaproteobacteria bacterium TMED150]HBQ22386.1 short-chain dehydrogenase [Alphaproteobacteria bacterium]MAW14785.1 short-chain dehydrogenase [Paracoccaceae bacterium]|tara:strand:+ start:549 stop:1286 length:738 start_codon:yes stop_codon:yes gene_type:complete
MESKPICLIIGAGDYIGAAIAKRFAKGGFHVVLGRRRGDLLAPLIAKIEAAGGTAQGFTWDARKEETAKEMFAHVENVIGPIEICIFNVGGNVKFPILETTERIFRKVWEMCAYGAFLSGREAAKYMVTRQKGSIFFTGATASVRGSSGFAAFASGKFALRGLAQSMARELGPKNIHVAHLVIDAGVDTEFVRDRLRQAGKDPDELQPDTLMNPDSIAETYWYLHQQRRDGWTHELDIRPHAETW